MEWIQREIKLVALVGVLGRRSVCARLICILGVPQHSRHPLVADAGSNRVENTPSRIGVGDGDAYGDGAGAGDVVCRVGVGVQKGRHDWQHDNDDDDDASFGGTRHEEILLFRHARCALLERGAAPLARPACGFNLDKGIGLSSPVIYMANGFPYLAGVFR